jgi:hypothetical protein
LCYALLYMGGVKYLFNWELWTWYMFVEEWLYDFWNFISNLLRNIKYLLVNTISSLCSMLFIIVG